MYRKGQQFNYKTWKDTARYEIVYLLHLDVSKWWSRKKWRSPRSPWGCVYFCIRCLWCWYWHQRNWFGRHKWAQQNFSSTFTIKMIFHLIFVPSWYIQFGFALFILYLTKWSRFLWNLSPTPCRTLTSGCWWRGSSIFGDLIQGTTQEHGKPTLAVLFLGYCWRWNLIFWQVWTWFLLNKESDLFRSLVHHTSTKRGLFLLININLNDSANVTSYSRKSEVNFTTSFAPMKDPESLGLHNRGYLAFPQFLNSPLHPFQGPESS